MLPGRLGISGVRASATWRWTLSLSSSAISPPTDVALSATTFSSRRWVSTAASSSSAVNFYKRLQVEADATPEEIKAAYRRLALKWHPDVVEDSKRAQADVQFRMCSEAYETLSDPVKRRGHDDALGVQTSRRQHKYSAPAATEKHKKTATGASEAGKDHASFTSSYVRNRASASASAASRGGDTQQQQQHQSARKKWRKPYVRGDADRTFTDAFEGRTLDQILFEARRRERVRKAASAATSSSEATEGEKEESAGRGVAAGHEESMRRVMDHAAETFAQRAQRQYGGDILKHIRAVSVPSGPSPPPDTHMPFRPFANTTVPPGVTTPPEPKMGPVTMPQEGEEVLLSKEEIDLQEARLLPHHELEDGTPITRGGMLNRIQKNVRGSAYNMGQLYSYHRPY